MNLQKPLGNNINLQTATFHINHEISAIDKLFSTLESISSPILRRVIFTGNALGEFLDHGPRIESAFMDNRLAIGSPRVKLQIISHRYTVHRLVVIGIALRLSLLGATGRIDSCDRTADFLP